MKRGNMRLLTITALLCVLVAGAQAAAGTDMLELSDGSFTGLLDSAKGYLQTDAFNWADEPLLTFVGWQAYGTNGSVYYACLQWADGWMHFDKREDTVKVCTLAVTESTRGTAGRYVEQVSRDLSVYGRMVFRYGSGSVHVDSIGWTRDRR